MKAKRLKPRRTQHPVQMARTIPDRLGHLTHIAHTTSSADAIKLGLQFNRFRPKTLGTLAKRGRKRRTAHPIPSLPRRLQDGSGTVTKEYTVTTTPALKHGDIVTFSRCPPFRAGKEYRVVDPTVVDLRQLAKGRECYARLPGCLRTTETVVLAHLRRGHVAGMGEKPPDICALPMCAHCHDLVDGRAPHIDWDLHKSWIDSEILRGLCQWLAYLWNQGIIKT